MKTKMAKLNAIIRKYPLLVAIGYFFIYFPIFTLLEKYRQPQYYVHCWLDDMMPFCEYFIIPYLLWFAFVPGMLLFFIRYSRADYFKCCKIIFGGMSICLLIYWLFPTGLMLRETVEATGFLASCINTLRGVDTPTNVCPSIHVSSTVGICMVLMRSKELKRFRKLKVFSAVLGVAICMSTVVLDQHSIIDVICGIILSSVLCGLVEEAQLDSDYPVQKEYLH